MILRESRLPELAAAADPRLQEWQDRELAQFGRKLKRLTLADPRLGKTFVSTRWLRGLAASLGVEQMLVSAPLRVCPTWEFVLDAAGMPVVPLYDLSSAAARTQLHRDWQGVMLINHDKLWPLRERLYHNLQAFVADEVHHFASPSSHKGKAGRRIAHNATFVRALTATPAGNHKGNLWSPLSMVGAYTGSWTSFAERYLVRDIMFPKVIKAVINEEELDAMLKRYASIIPRDSVFGPDDYQFVHREVRLPDMVVALYRKLAREWVIDAPVELVADHTLTRHLRLQQITSGYLPHEDGGLHLLHTAKIDTAIADLDEIMEAGKKAVVFHRFVEEGAELVRRLESAGVPTYIVNGSINATQSERNRVEFQQCHGEAVMVVQIQSGGEGINLDTAEYALYLSRTYSYINDKQSRDRVFAPGKPRTIIYYEVPGTIDVTISHALGKKQDVQDSVMQLSPYAAVFGEVA